MISSKDFDGAWSEEKAATPEVQSIVNKIKDEIQAKKNLSMDINKGVSYCEQIDNGKNYRILIHATKDVYIAVQVCCKNGDNADPEVTEIFENSLTMSKNTQGVREWSEVLSSRIGVQNLVAKVIPQFNAETNNKYGLIRKILEYIYYVSSVFHYRVRIQTDEEIPIVIEFILIPATDCFPELIQVFTNSLTLDLLPGSSGSKGLGGWSQDRAANKDIQDLVDLVKKQVEERTQLKLTINKALIYALQDVGGLNYRIWIHANETTYLAIQVDDNPSEGPRLTHVFENSLTMSKNSIDFRGWSHEKRNDKEITKLALEVRPQVETRTGKKFSMFEVIVYIQQYVQGVISRARVQVDADNYITIQFQLNLTPFGAQPKLSVIINSSLADGYTSRGSLA